MKKLFWWSFVALVVGYMLRPIRDPDLWFHIVVGRWILSHYTLPAVDYWNQFAAGTSWRSDYWSVQILFALVDRKFGIEGLLGLKLAVLFMFVLALLFALQRIAGNAIFGALLSALAAVGCYWHATLRPQTIAWIFYIGIILVCERLRRNGWSNWAGAQLLLVTCLWSNSHPSVPFGVAVTLIWLVGASRAVLWRALGAATFGTLITPYGGREWLTFAQMVGHPIQFKLVTELQPATVLEYSTLPLLTATALLMYLCHKQPKALTPPTGGLWAVFLFGALAVKRGIPFAVILTCALATRVFRESPVVSDIFARFFEGLRLHVQKLPVVAGVACVFFCMAAARISYIWSQPLDTLVVPKAAVDFIEDNRLPHPILNSLGQGHYLIYRYSDEEGQPRYRVPIDGRTNINSSELWGKFNAAFLGTEQWQDLLEVVKPITVIWPTTSPFVRLLMATNKWCLVYQDGTLSGVSVLVERNFWKLKEEPLPSLNCLRS